MGPVMTGEPGRPLRVRRVARPPDQLTSLAPQPWQTVGFSGDMRGRQKHSPTPIIDSASFAYVLTEVEEEVEYRGDAGFGPGLSWRGLAGIGPCRR